MVVFLGPLLLKVLGYMYLLNMYYILHQNEKISINLPAICVLLCVRHCEKQLHKFEFNTRHGSINTSLPVMAATVRLVENNHIQSAEFQI